MGISINDDKRDTFYRVHTALEKNCKNITEMNIVNMSKRQLPNRIEICQPKTTNGSSMNDKENFIPLGKL